MLTARSKLPERYVHLDLTSNFVMGCNSLCGGVDHNSSNHGQCA